MVREVSNTPKWWQTDGGCGPRLDGALFAMIFAAVAVACYLAALVGMLLGF